MFSFTEPDNLAKGLLFPPLVSLERDFMFFSNKIILSGLENLSTVFAR